MCLVYRRKRLVSLQVIGSNINGPYLPVFKSCLFFDGDDYVKIWCLISSNFELL